MKGLRRQIRSADPWASGERALHVIQTEAAPIAYQPLR
jgi:hypothetical protein